MSGRIAANADWNRAFFSCLLPPRDGCSPCMDVPDWRVTGAMPAYAARWAASLNREMSPPVARRIVFCQVEVVPYMA